MILGITGKSGTGKHTVAHFFEQRGWKILDADKIAHQLYHPYQRVWRQIVERFGEGILTKDDLIDRQKLKKIIFTKGVAAKKARHDLNDIVHPELRRYLEDEVYYVRKKNVNTIIVAALWEELELFKLCDKILLITAGDALAYERIHKRDSIDFEIYEMTTASQKVPEKVDFTVVNELDIQELYKKLNGIVTMINSV